MAQRSKMPSSTTLPAPTMLLPYSSYVDLLYHNQALMQAHMMHQDMDTHNNTMMKVLMVMEAAVVAVQGFGGHIRLVWALANIW